MPPSRRRVLAVTGFLLTAGCIESSPAGPATDRDSNGTESPEPSDRSATDTDDCHSGVTVTTDPYAPVSELPVDLDQQERSIAATAANEAHADFETYGQAPLRADAIVRQDGAFYRTDYSEATAEEVPAYTMDVYWENGQTAPAEATVVGFEDLPATDRQALRIAAVSPEDGGREDGEGGDGLPQETLSVGEFPAPYPDGGTDSQLIGTRTWVRWHDRTFSVDVADESIATQERQTYGYTLERVAADESAFHEFVGEEYLVELTDLPASQRSIVSAAVEDHYEECLPDSDALGDLRERLSEKPSLPQPSDRSWYVTFEGRRYRLAILEWSH